MGEILLVIIGVAVFAVTYALLGEYELTKKSVASVKTKPDWVVFKEDGGYWAMNVKNVGHLTQAQTLAELGVHMQELEELMNDQETQPTTQNYSTQ